METMSDKTRLTMERRCWNHFAKTLLKFEPVTICVQTRFDKVKKDLEESD
jgi:hypothetical protein